MKVSKYIILAFVLIAVSIGVLPSCSSEGIHVREQYGLYGLYDGDSLILPPKYHHIEFLDSVKRFVLTREPVSGVYADSIYTIFDILNKRFIFEKSEDFGILGIEKINHTDYKLVCPFGIRWFATLCLPDDSRRQALIIPHFNDSIISEDQFLEIGINTCELDISGTWNDMLFSNPHAFYILYKIKEMRHLYSDEYLSPESDLSYAKAVEWFVDKDERYHGNFDLAMSEMRTLIRRLDDNCYGRQDMTDYGRRVWFLSDISLSRAYNKMIEDNPSYKNEYIAWHNLIEALSLFHDFKIHDYGGWSYNDIRDGSLVKGDWLSDRQSQLADERAILLGKKHKSKSTKPLRTKDDIIDLCSQYHDSEGCYHPMWNEAYYAFAHWLQERENISDSLPAEYSEEYRKYTDIVVDYLYDIIKDTHDYKGDIW